MSHIKHPAASLQLDRFMAHCRRLSLPSSLPRECERVFPFCSLPPPVQHKSLLLKNLSLKSFQSVCVIYLYKEILQSLER